MGLEVQSLLGLSVNSQVLLVYSINVYFHLFSARESQRPEPNVPVISGLLPALEKEEERRETKHWTQAVYPDLLGSDELHTEHLQESERKVHIMKQPVTTSFTML